MKPYASYLRGVAVALVAFQLSACGRSDPSGDAPLPNDSASSQDSAGASGAPTAAGGCSAAADGVAAGGATAGSAQPFTLGVADLDAYERGLQREIEILQLARERFASAADDEARLEILAEIQPRVLRQAGAEAAAVPEERYRTVTDTVSDVLGKLEMGDATRQMMPSEQDLAQMPPELRAQVEENIRQMRAALGDPYEGLEADTAAALEARVDALRALRAEHAGLLLSVGR